MVMKLGFFCSQYDQKYHEARSMVLYQLSDIIINYLEIPNAIPNTYWTGNHLREGAEVRVQVYDDELPTWAL